MPDLPDELPGQWVAWDNSQAMQQPSLIAAVQAFDAGPDGKVPTDYLRDDALGDDPQVRTHLYIENGQVDAFYSLRMAEVTLHQKHQAKSGASRPTIGAATILYAARRPGSKVHRDHIASDAVGVALLARQHIGVTLLGFEPGTEGVADEWRKAGWRNSQTPVPHDATLRRMWLPLTAYEE